MVTIMVKIVTKLDRETYTYSYECSTTKNILTTLVATDRERDLASPASVSGVV